MAASCLLWLGAASGAAATDPRGTVTASGEIVTYEVAPREIVTREISDEVIVKEVSPPHIVIKPKRTLRKEATARLEMPSTGRVAPVTTDAIAIVSDMATFLDRLMHAESRGRENAANPRSTALGPFQFIKSTFLDVARRHFPALTGELSDTQVLSLRTLKPFARSAAEAYTRENAAQLKEQGHEPTWSNLRLAFLLGAQGASRVLQAPPSTPLTKLLDGNVLQANPFMARMTTDDLVAKAMRDVNGREPTAATPANAPAAAPEPRTRPRPAA